MSNGWPDRRHQPAVSHSSISKFRACDRMWALQYHHAIIPNVQTKHQFKREARLQPLNCYPGSVFHETIQIALQTQCSTGLFPTNLMEIATDVAREYIRFSRRWNADVKAHPILGGMHPYWPDHDFAQPIDCLYFDGDFPPGYRAMVKEKLTRWFDRFVELMPNLPFSTVNYSNWIFPKTKTRKIPWFVHNDDFAVYAAFDFLTRQDGIVSIYDWKTGSRQRGEQQVADQLMTYAAFATHEWNVDPDRIRLYAVWVDDGSVQTVECDPFEITRLEEIWKSHHDLWSNRLDQVNGDAERLLDIFPLTSNLRECSRCSFRSCEGRERIAAGSTESSPNIEFWDD